MIRRREQWPVLGTVRACLAAGVSAAILMLAACARTGGGRVPCPAGEKCLNVVSIYGANAIDPHKLYIMLESEISHHLLVGLTALDSRGQTIPGMAKTWTASPDGLTWTFKLRQATWTDGQPVTAHDFVFSLRRILDPKTAGPYNAPLTVIVNGKRIVSGDLAPETLGVSAPDSRTVVIKLSQPAPTLPAILAYSAALPVPAHVVRRWGDAWIRPEHFVGNGAYTLQDFTVSGDVVLQANPRYFTGQRPCFTRVWITSSPDSVTNERRVASGELDISMSFASGRGRLLRRTMPGYVRAEPIAAAAWLAFNVRSPKLRDARVRRALAMTIDQDFIVGKLSGGGERVLSSYSPPNLPGYDPPQQAWAGLPYERRKAEARRLMGQAGYSPEHPLRLEFKFPMGTARAFPPLLQSDWRDIGVELSITQEEMSGFYADLRAGNFEVGFIDWVIDYVDPGVFTALLKTGETSNYSGYSDPEYDTLVERASGEPDAERRLALLREAETIILRDLPVAPVLLESQNFLVNPRLTGFHSNPLGTHRFDALCERPAEPVG